MARSQGSVHRPRIYVVQAEGKVMFSQAPVILFREGEVSIHEPPDPPPPIEGDPPPPTARVTLPYRVEPPDRMIRLDKVNPPRQDEQGAWSVLPRNVCGRLSC